MNSLKSEKLNTEKIKQYQQSLLDSVKAFLPKEEMSRLTLKLQELLETTYQVGGVNREIFINKLNKRRNRNEFDR